jgi:hypothetical protein
VLSLTQTRVLMALSQPGRYRLAVRYSPYWRASSGCVSRTQDGMVALLARHAGWVRLRFEVRPSNVLATIVGDRGDCGHA